MAQPAQVLVYLVTAVPQSLDSARALLGERQESNRPLRARLALRQSLDRRPKSPKGELVSLVQGGYRGRSTLAT